MYSLTMWNGGYENHAFGHFIQAYTIQEMLASFPGFPGREGGESLGTRLGNVV